ncbi:hypothetical protein GQF42_22165 [Streptomyces broussonetiae]|uniref:Secreted protein n=1 Tax=Streptomyces broussonetiae TaxID=2686304 RepID=A0A6I6NHE3_9ACTN|nr:hypothetical protein GQF42_22165 [Streptomyces broussonetiae]
MLVLLLALWVPLAHAQAQAAPALVAASGICGHYGSDGSDGTDALDGHDGLDGLVRPPVRALHRTDAPERPAPLPDPAPARPALRPCPGAPRAPYAIPLLRTVVLRC